VLGIKLIKIKIREHLTEDEAMIVEMALIKAIGRLDQGTGPLVNLTDGGEGTTGWKPTEETRKKLGQHLKGKHLSPEHRQKLCTSHHGVPKSPAHIESMRLARLGEKNHMFGKRWKQSAETCEKKRAALKGRRPSDATIAAVRAYSLGHHPSEETRSKMRASAPKTKSPEHKAKIKAALIAFHSRKKQDDQGRGHTVH
jgi:hypothetical protein